MKWGQRKKVETGKTAANSQRISQMDEATKAAHRRKMLLAGGAATVAIGAIGVGVYMKANGASTMSVANKARTTYYGKVYLRNRKPSEQDAIPPALLERATKAIAQAKKTSISKAELQKIRLTASQNTTKLGPMTPEELDKLRKSAGKPNLKGPSRLQKVVDNASTSAGLLGELGKTVREASMSPEEYKAYKKQQRHQRVLETFK